MASDTPDPTDRRPGDDEPPGKDDDTPETPLDEPRPPRIEDPPPHPNREGPYVVRGQERQSASRESSNRQQRTEAER